MFSKLAKVANAAFAVALGAALLATGAGAADADPGPPVVGGGSGIIIDNQFECTVTTVGYDGAGRLVGMTAGHCGDPGAQVYAEADGSTTLLLDGTECPHTDYNGRGIYEARIPPRDVPRVHAVVNS